VALVQGISGNKEEAEVKENQNQSKQAASLRLRYRQELPQNRALLVQNVMANVLKEQVVVN